MFTKEDSNEFREAARLWESRCKLVVELHEKLREHQRTVGALGRGVEQREGLSSWDSGLAAGLGSQLADMADLHDEIANELRLQRKALLRLDAILTKLKEYVDG